MFLFPGSVRRYARAFFSLSFSPWKWFDPWWADCFVANQSEIVQRMCGFLKDGPTGIEHIYVEWLTIFSRLQKIRRSPLIPSDELGAFPKSDVIKRVWPLFFGSDDVNRLGRPCWRAKAGAFTVADDWRRSLDYWQTVIANIQARLIVLLFIYVCC